MRQCERCKSYMPDDAQFCANCGNSLIVSSTVTSTLPSQTPGRPPEPPRRQRYTYFIPGLGAFGLLRRDSVTGQWDCAPGCLITSIFIAILSLSGFLFLRLHNPPTVQASLSIDHVVPGETMHVHGSNFPPGSNVKITVDENSAASYTLAFVSIGDSTLQKKLLRPTDTIVTVQNDGTFDTTIPVPTTWTPGSLHTIRATTQNAQTSAQASTKVKTEIPRKPTLTPTKPTTLHYAPTLSGISPASGPAAGGTIVTVSGGGFTNATGVFFDSTLVPGVNVLSDSRITVVSPAGSGTVDVMVNTPYGTSKTSSSDRFTYITSSSGTQQPPAQPPAVSGLSPTRGSSNGGTSVTIIGSGFNNVTAVLFGSTKAASFIIVSDKQIIAVSPAGSGTVDVRVTAAKETSKTSGADQFTYLPEVDSISPAKGPEAGGTPVTINGVGFVHASKVAFGSAVIDCSNGNNCTISSDGTQITVQSPHEDLSDESQPDVDVTVTNAAGNTSLVSRTDKFTYTPGG